MLLKERLPEFETSPALELSKRPALILEAQGASPSMRERRNNGYYDALFRDKLQPGLKAFVPNSSDKHLPETFSSLSVIPIKEGS